MLSLKLAFSKIIVARFADMNIEMNIEMGEWR